VGLAAAVIAASSGAQLSEGFHRFAGVGEERRGKAEEY
jgi:hypothetical protein